MFKTSLRKTQISISVSSHIQNPAGYDFWKIFKYFPHLNSDEIRVKTGYTDGGNKHLIF